MKLPKTIRGWISIMRTLEGESICRLRGFDSLSAEDKEHLMILNAEISNNINEVKAYRE